MPSTYILIDTTLIDHPLDKPWIKKRRKPSWVAALYDRDAIEVSPILIDIDRAIHCNRLDAMMALVNAIHPQLGISFIDTDQTLAQLQAHLRQFIYIKAEDDTELTLRFADCTVLPALAASLTKEQWSSIVSPLQSWKIHGRDGLLKMLPIFKSDKAVTLPWSLSSGQISFLKNSMGADQLLANLRKMRPSRAASYSTLVAHEYAEQARQIWLSAGRAEDTELLLFARDVLDTDGRILRLPSLKKVLEQEDAGIRRKDLERMVSLNLGEG